IAGRTGAENLIIVSLIEVLNIFAHIGCGWVADQPEVSVLVVNYIALMMAGLDTMIFRLHSIPIHRILEFLDVLRVIFYWSCLALFGIALGRNVSKSDLQIKNCSSMESHQ
uniref:Uncharacterized protein n=1 Tax=Caenorhabditis japonica TaxID=281687 RepID=A0A8R1IAD2_CAEJA